MSEFERETATAKEAQANEAQASEWLLAVEPPPGSWTRSDNHFSAPPSPLFTSIFEPNFREAGRKVFGEFGMPMGEDFIHTTIGGWFYIGADTDKQKPPPMPPA